jgi:hypothetical protein
MIYAPTHIKAIPATQKCLVFRTGAAGRLPIFHSGAPPAGARIIPQRHGGLLPKNWSRWYESL